MYYEIFSDISLKKTVALIKNPLKNWDNVPYGEGRYNTYFYS
jgi:hypothetical protein